MNETVEQRLAEANRKPLYVCPNKHRWETESREGEAPLANIKCPNCGKTAIRHYRAVPDPQWDVQPLRRIEGDVGKPREDDDG